MPTYQVTFELPVIYLPDDPLHRRVVTDLPVLAPDGPAAIVHAIRVTRGDGGSPTATLIKAAQHA